MKTVEDFTEARVGSQIPFGGIIALCPKCGRAGLLEYLADVAAEFVHVETEEVMGDGMLVEPIDSCAIPA
ncbi:MAG: hypothetical protein ACRD16_17285 [Thermoanaerobaculia bacterium]